MSEFMSYSNRIESLETTNRILQNHVDEQEERIESLETNNRSLQNQVDKQEDRILRLLDYLDLTVHYEPGREVISKRVRK